MQVTECDLEMLGDKSMLASGVHMVFSLWSSIRRYTNLKKILRFSSAGVLEGGPRMILDWAKYRENR
jgi:hypothetical protein